MFQFVPKEEAFFEMFVRQGQTIARAASLLIEVMKAPSQSAAIVKEIKELEHQADQITHEIFTKLNKTFIVPIDREDIHNLASSLDDIIDLTDAVAQKVQLYRIDTPLEDTDKLAAILHQASLQVVQALSSLKDFTKALEICIEINRLENEADTVSRDIISQIFNSSKDPILVMKWSKIVETLEDAVDGCEDVANVIEGIVVKNG